jgi:glycosyltransferase involved in cell wall biosynthesis
MKIVMLTGSYPPDPCGVGDNTAALVEALQAQGVSVAVVTGENWHAWQVRRLMGRIARHDPDVVHIQYPTVGFGTRLGPHLCSLLLPGVVTLHEVSAPHILRRLSLYAFTVSSRRLVFTTEGERRYAARFAPWIRSKSVVIPIGSAIRVGTRPRDLSGSSVLFFGLIRPNRGLEDVLALARLIAARNADLRVRIVGRPDARYEDYCRGLQEAARGLPVDWMLELPEPEVADRLAEATFAYAPFPDGASERRSSLLALLSNGVPTVTTRGAQTPPELAEAALFAGSTEEALAQLLALRDDREARDTLSQRARSYAQRFDWGEIARAHIRLYEAVRA